MSNARAYAAQLGWMGCVLLMMTSATWAEDPQNDRLPARELFVPFESLDVILESDVRRVYLTRDEYEKLQTKARHAPQDKAPVDFALLAADYDATLEQGRAVMTGRLRIELMTDRLVAVPLQLSGVGLRQATLDGQPAPMGREPRGPTHVFVKGRGMHDLTLEMVLPLETSAAQQTLRFHVPGPAAARLHLSVPGNVEVKSGGEVLSRKVDAEANVTRLEVLKQRGPTELMVSLNNRLLQQQREVIARSVLVDELTKSYERLHATVSLEVLHGAVEQFRFEVAPGFEITRVESPLLDHWVVEQEGEQSLLVAHLREPTTDPVVLNVLAVRTPPSFENWQLPTLVPRDVSGHIAVVGVLAAETLRLHSLDPQGLIAIDTETLTAALPASVFQAEDGAPPLRPIVAYYAPAGTYQLDAQWEQPEPGLRVTSNLLLLLSDEDQQIRGGFAIVGEVEPLHAIEFTAPDDWFVNQVTLADGSVLPLERYDNRPDDEVAAAADDPAAAADADAEPAAAVAAAEGPSKLARYRVALPRGIPAGESLGLYFHATRIPNAWLEDWKEATVTFPRFSVRGAAHDVGALAVHVRDDQVVFPDELEGLTPLDDGEKGKYGLADVPTTMVYRYLEPDYRAVFKVRKKTPRLTARTYSFLRVATGSLTAHYEVAFEIQDAATDQLEIRLSATTPAALSIRGLDGVALKDYVSREEDAFRVWTITLDERHRGRVRVAVDFQQPLENEDIKAFSLPLVEALDVLYQSGMVAVEGAPELEIEITEHPRRIDVGELVDAAYQPGRNLLGAFGYIKPGVSVVLDVHRREGYGLPPTVVQRAEIVTAVSTSGVSQTSARFALKSKALFLQVVLPPDSTLWTVYLDRQPIKPQRENDTLLINLPPSVEAATRDLQIVYETPVRGLELVGTVSLEAPRLLLRFGKDEAAREVPLADLKWDLILPPGYRMMNSSGSVFPVKHGEGPWSSFALDLPSISLSGVKSADSAASTVEDDMYDDSASMTEAEGSEMGQTVPSPVYMDDDVQYEAAPPQAPAPNAAVPQDSAPAGERQTDDGRNVVPADEAIRPGDDPFASDDSEKLPATTPGEPNVDLIITQSEELHEEDKQAADSSGRLGGQTGGFGPSSGPGRGAYSYWALEGLAGLNIELEHTGGEQVTFQSLGENPRLVATLADRDRLLMAGYAAALTILLFGVLLLWRSISKGIVMIVGIWVLCGLLPMLTGWEYGWNQLTDAPLTATLILLPFYALGLVLRWAMDRIAPAAARGQGSTSQGRFGPSGTVPPSPASLLLLVTGAVTAASLVGASPAMAQHPAMNQPAVDSPEALVETYQAQSTNVSAPEQRALVHPESGQTLWIMPVPPRPVPVPSDAVIIPFDPEDENGIRNAKKLLVPYERYVELWNQAYPDARLTEIKPPADGALSDVQYEVTLQGTDYLVVTGRMQVHVFGTAMDLPLSLGGGVLSDAQLDGKPAPLRIVQPLPEYPTAQPPNQPPVPRDAPQRQGGVVPQQGAVPQPQGEVPPRPGVPFPQPGAPAPRQGFPTVQMPPDNQLDVPIRRTAGPRNAAPIAPLVVLRVDGKGSHRLEMSVRIRLERQGGWRVAQGRLPAAAATALSLKVPEAQTEVRLRDVPDRATHETTVDNETIQTALGPDGVFRLQWRPQVSEGQIDRTLTARSEALLDVREDGMRLVWQLQFEFRRSQREGFTLNLPPGYAVQSVTGPNVRGWERKADGDATQLEVTLLKPAQNNEQLTLVLFRRAALGQDEATRFAAPRVEVPDAMLHQGRMIVNRSPLLDVTIEEAAGLSRTDYPGDVVQRLQAVDAGEASPLGARPFQAYQFSASTYNLAFLVEPIHPHVAARVQSLVKLTQSGPTFEARLHYDVSKRRLYVVRATLPEALQLEEVSAPAAHQWAVLEEDNRRVLYVYLSQGAQGTFSILLRGKLGDNPPDEALPIPTIDLLDTDRQEGDLVIQADPAWDVRATDLQNCESVLLGRTFDWLDPSQRSLARLALHYRSGEGSGQIRISPRAPVVSCETLSNVRVTKRALLETILLNFTIREAGVRELSFLLPKRMETARISVPMLRQQIVEPAQLDGEPAVRVRLQLQDDLMGELRVLVEQDRMLSDEIQQVAIPRVETALVRQQFVTFESAGRDEVIVDQQQELNPLSRHLKQWSALVELLGAEPTQAFVVSASATRPRLAFHTKDRAAVITAGARIGMSQAVLVLDGSGAFRGTQTYRVDNATEQYLELEVPVRARIWTAHVAGSAVKPSPVSGTAGRLRVPLVKTAEGDLDYEVVIRYGGLIGDLDTGSEVSFPLLQTVNIKVEQTQVRLWLPETQHWFDFGGNARHVTNEGSLTAGFLAYQTRNLERYSSILSSGSSYSKARTLSNVKSLRRETESLKQHAATHSSGDSVSKEVNANDRAWAELESQVDQLKKAQQPALVQQDNRARLKGKYDSQEIGRAKNVVEGLGSNFKQTDVGDRPIETGPGQPDQERFSQDWFLNNQLNLQDASEEFKDQKRVLAGKTAKPTSDAMNQPQAQELGKEQGQEARQQYGELQQEIRRQEEAASSGEEDERQQALRYQNRLSDRDSLTRSPARRPQEAQSNEQGGRAARIDVGRASGNSRQTDTGRQLDMGDSFEGVGGEGRIEPFDEPISMRMKEDTLSAGMSGRDVFSTDLDVPWASLDVDFPKRGQEYLFTTPRGDVVITARVVGTRAIDRIVRMLAAALVVVLGLVAVRLSRRIGWPRLVLRTVALLLVPWAAVLLLSGTLMVFGGFLLLFGLALVAILFRQGVPAASRT